jgi:hypothetical protein
MISQSGILGAHRLLHFPLPVPGAAFIKINWAIHLIFFSPRTIYLTY